MPATSESQDMFPASRSLTLPFASLSVLLAAGLLAGCIFERSQEAKEARTQLIGMSRSQILACAGQPRSTVKDGDLEVFSYYVGAPNYDEILGIKPTDAQRITGTSQPKNCRVRIMFRSGIVDKVDYSGNTGGLFSRDETCASVINRCLPSAAK